MTVPHRHAVPSASPLRPRPPHSRHHRPAEPTTIPMPQRRPSWHRAVAGAGGEDARPPHGTRRHWWAAQTATPPRRARSRRPAPRIPETACRTAAHSPGSARPTIRRDQSRETHGDGPAGSYRRPAQRTGCQDQAAIGLTLRHGSHSLMPAALTRAKRPSTPELQCLTARRHRRPPPLARVTRARSDEKAQPVWCSALSPAPSQGAAGRKTRRQGRIAQPRRSRRHRQGRNR